MLMHYGKLNFSEMLNITHSIELLAYIIIGKTACFPLSSRKVNQKKPLLKSLQSVVSKYGNGKLSGGKRPSRK